MLNYKSFDSGESVNLINPSYIDREIEPNVFRHELREYPDLPFTSDDFSLSNQLKHGVQMELQRTIVNNSRSTVIDNAQNLLNQVLNK